MTVRDENLPRVLTRRNWVILAALVVLSAFWRSLPITLGVASGGLVATLGFAWMQRSLKRVMARPSRGGALVFQFMYLLRLAAIAAILYLLIVIVRVNLWGLAVGLSVVVLNIFWETIARIRQSNPK